jgi:hypothetical protein
VQPHASATVPAAALPAADPQFSASGAASRKVSPHSCAPPMVPALALEGATVHAAPDSVSDVITTLEATTRVCAATASQGFRFRRVTLPDSTQGFIKESNFSD